MEVLYKIEIGEVQISVILYDEAFEYGRTQKKHPSLSEAFHCHSMFELFFIEHGTLTLITEHYEKTYENAILIVPPHMKHYTLSHEFNGGSFYFSIHATAADIPKCPLLNALREPIRLTLSSDDTFYFEHIKNASEAETPHLLFLFFSSLLRRLVPAKTSDTPTFRTKRLKYINTIDTYISQHLHEPIRLQNLSSILFLCPKQITRIIQREYGCSLSVLIHRQRMEAACALLKQTSLEIKEIARRVGYENETYFYAIFKKAYGTSPASYRRNCAQ